MITPASSIINTPDHPRNNWGNPKGELALKFIEDFYRIPSSDSVGYDILETCRKKTLGYRDHRRGSLEGLAGSTYETSGEI